MKINWKKVLIIAGPILVGGAVAYYLVKKKGNGAPSASTIAAIGSTAPPLKVTKTNSSFPLHNGSNNSYVKQLQTALGVTADGIFGPQTLAALQSQYGVATVNNSNDLQQIINQANTNVNNRDLAVSLEAQFKAGGVKIYINSDYFADQYTEDSSGNLTPTGLGIQLYGGKSYASTDYTIDGASQLGYAIVIVTNGTLAGEYLVDPTIIRLVADTGSSAGSGSAYVPPYTDPSTGLTTF